MFQGTLPGMSICTYLTGQCSALLDEIALNCCRSRPIFFLPGPSVPKQQSHLNDRGVFGLLFCRSAVCRTWQETSNKTSESAPVVAFFKICASLPMWDLFASVFSHLATSMLSNQ